MIKPSMEVITPDGLATVEGLRDEIAGSRDWWVILEDGVKRFYAEENLQPLNEHRALPEKAEPVPETMPQVTHDMSRKQAMRLARRLQDENEKLGETLKFALNLMTPEQRKNLTEWAQYQL